MACDWFRMVSAPPVTLAMMTPLAPAVLPFALLLTSTLAPRSHTRILPFTLAGSSSAATASAEPKQRSRLSVTGTPSKPASRERISVRAGALAFDDAPVMVTP